MPPWLSPFLWLLNGLLVSLYLLADNLLVLLLIPPLGWLSMRTPVATAPDRQETPPDPQRPWIMAAAGMAFLAGLLAPNPVPFLLVLMAWAGVLALALEKFNPLNLRWRISQGLALYALIALGSALLQLYLRTAAFSGAAGAALSQGQSYITVIASIALWGYPLGYLALLAQTLWAHPPVGSPDQLIAAIRTRGKDQ